MRASPSFGRIASSVVCLALFAVASVTAGAQTDRFAGQWIAAEEDHGVLVSLTIGPSGTLTMPGLRLDGTSAALTLAIRNLTMRDDVALFSVDLPENEGTLELEFRAASGDDSGSLRVIRVNGAAADDDVPVWIVRKVG